MGTPLYDVRYGIEKSIRYHQRRRSFLESWHRVLMFVVILLGSASITDLAAELGVQKWLSIGAALLAALDLTTGIGVRSRDYAILQGRYTALLAEIIRAADPTDEQIREWQARRVEIEGDEPPIFWAIEADCDNEICLLKGRHDRVVHIPWFRLAIGHYLRQEGFNPQRPALKEIGTGGTA